MFTNNDIRILNSPQFTCISGSILTVTDRVKADSYYLPLVSVSFRLNLIIYSFEGEAKMKAEPD